MAAALFALASLFKQRKLDPVFFLRSVCLLKHKEFREAATLQKIATELSKSKFNTGKKLVVRCILGKSRGRILKNFPGGFAPRFLNAIRLTLMVCFCPFLSTSAEYRSFLLAHLRTLFTSGLLAKYVKQKHFP